MEEKILALKRLITGVETEAERHSRGVHIMTRHLFQLKGNQRQLSEENEIQKQP